MSRFAKVAHTERGLDRLINFSDAVIAIAATLLILPVIENLNDAFSAEGDGLSDAIMQDTAIQAFTFYFGFLVMAAFWHSHHNTFERVKDYSRGLIALNFLWLIAMVFFAFPVGFLYQPTAEVGALIATNMGVIFVLLSCTKIYVLRHPELLVDPLVKVDKRYYAFAFAPAATMFLIALTVIVFSEDYFAFIFLLLPLLLITRKYLLLRPPHTERGMDRLVNFSDAVVAIAITLLILPLVDIITDDRGGNAVLLVLGSTEVVAKIITFVFTFWVMSSFWLANHRLFENVKDYSRGLIGLTVVWLLLMVLLAIPSALIGQGLASTFDTNAVAFQGLAGFERENFYALAFLLFGFTVALIALATGLIASHVKRHPELLVDPKEHLSPRRSYYVAILFLVVGATPILLTRIGYGGNLVLLCWLALLILLPFVRNDDGAPRRPETRPEESI